MLKVCISYSTIISFLRAAREKVYFIEIYTFELERRKASHVVQAPTHLAAVAVAALHYLLH